MICHVLPEQLDHVASDTAATTATIKAFSYTNTD
jgi:hypothetical protein